MSDASGGGGGVRGMRWTPCVPVIYIHLGQAHRWQEEEEKSALKLVATTKTGRSDPVNRCAKQ